MVDLEQVQHHPAVEEIVDFLCNKVQNNDRHFFRTIVVYYLCTMAASMRAKVITQHKGEVPVNCYAIALATSGAGKGYSTGLMENEFMAGFRDRFVSETLPLVAETNLNYLASKRSAQNGTEEADEHQGLEREYNSTGAYLFAFDGGSEAAIKQIRQKLLLANLGSINLQVDEIGSKLTKEHIMEALNTYLELYDQGLIKQKLKMNSSENKRTVEIHGKTPANAFLFGTPDKLLDGAKIEEAFFSFLETGYARRSLFAFGKEEAIIEEEDAEAIYDMLIDPQANQGLSKWATHFTALADPDRHNWLIELQRDEAIELVSYEVECKKRARMMPKFDVIRRAEMKHRYFKVLKIAGALAFVDESITITKAHLHAAMKLVEESGEAFKDLMERDRAHAKIAKHIADISKSVTHADLVQDLPFYPKTSGARNELMSLAIAWGYKNCTIIRKTFSDGIEFFSGEALKPTDLNEINLSYSQHYAQDYLWDKARFDDLPLLTQMKDFHWCTHEFKDGHRTEDNVIPGFNLLVVDVDGTADLAQTHKLLEDYTFMTYTTKRHTPQEHRFRLIFPMNYHLKLDREDFSLFVENFLKWLPIKVDEAAMQRSRKWQTNDKGQYHINHGDLIDVLPFIPKTSRNEEFHARNKELASLDNLERWFAERMVNGNRNNHMIKFALALVDCGKSYVEVENAVLGFNNKLAEPLPLVELKTTVLTTVMKKFNQVP